MNKQLICDYINYNAPTLHDLGDKLRAMVDAKYRLRHIGEDITPSQIANMKCNSKCLQVVIDKGIKGSPAYKIPRPLKLSPKSVLSIRDKRVYQEYILSLTSGTFFWDNFIIFHSNLYWMFTVIPEPFELPRWFIMDKYDEFINIKFTNGMSCPVIQTEDGNYNTVLTAVDNDYIQNLIS
jgi:hypothetical protein